MCGPQPEPTLFFFLGVNRYVDRLLNRDPSVGITHAPYPRGLLDEDESMDADERDDVDEEADGRDDEGDNVDADAPREHDPSD
jgi:hypothetical protein